MKLGKYSWSSTEENSFAQEDILVHCEEYRKMYGDGFVLLNTNRVLLLVLWQSRSERQAAQKSEWLRLWRKK